MEELLRDYPIALEIPVAWGEMDAFQHLNNVVYFRYFESARIAYFRAIDMLAVMQTTGIGPILAETSCRYRIPLTFPDTVRVGARVSTLQSKGFIMDYGIASRQHGKIAAEGNGRIVMVNYSGGGKAHLPEAVRSRIQALEGERLAAQ